MTLNERYTQDDFTSISYKGKAVVDYQCVPHDNFINCKSFKVLTVQEIIDKHNLHGLIGERLRPPDHSALVTELQCYYCPDHSENNSNRNYNTGTKYKLHKVPLDFMSSELANAAILNIITLIENARDTQASIDSV